MNHSCWWFLYLYDLCLLSLHILLNMLLEEIRFSITPLPSKPWPHLTCIPNVPAISEPQKHQGQNAFSSTWNSMSEFVKTPWRVLTLMWHTWRNTKSHWKVEGRWSETEVTGGIKTFKRLYLSQGVSSVDDTEGPAWKKVSVFLTISLPHLFFLHSGFIPLASQCPISHELVFSKIDMT